MAILLGFHDRGWNLIFRRDGHRRQITKESEAWVDEVSRSVLFADQKCPQWESIILPREAGCETGWVAVCQDCAKDFGRFHDVQYFKAQSSVQDDAKCENDWDKRNLITQPGGYDVNDQ